MAVETLKAHGTWKRIEQGLAELGYNQPNTSAIEPFNATARRMNAHQVRRSLSFAHRPQTRQALAWWSACVYNWVRPHRSLRQSLEQPQGKQLYQSRTPAMAMGLTDETWNADKLLCCVVYPPA